MNTGTPKLTQAEIVDIRLTEQLKASIQLESKKKLLEVYHEAKLKISFSTEYSMYYGKRYDTCFLGEKFSDFPVISKLAREYCLIRGRNQARAGEWGYTIVKGYPVTGIHNYLPAL
jgi:hypothetical protein